MAISLGTSTSSFQPPKATGPGAEQPGSERLKPPEAGHKRARRWWYAGVVAYIGLCFVLLNTLHQAAQGAGMSASGTLISLFGLGENPNYAVTVLVGSGIVLTVASAISAWLDIRKIASEEDDIEFVDQTRGERLDLVFVDRSVRGQLLKSEPVAINRTVRVESLLDDRVRRVRAVQLSGSGTISVDELRNVAERRAAQFGVFARYASSLLLLLAVLGTFAGVKTALPGLIQAVSSSTAEGAGLTRPLEAIAAAFGGNALALVGAIAVGLMAQGIAFGRQNMLDRLELISSEFVYRSEAAVGTDPLQAAIGMLRETASEFREAAGELSGIETGLGELSESFRVAFDGLGKRLGEIADRQEAGLYDKTGSTLEALQLRVSELTRSVEGNALAYAGLVASVANGTEQTRQSIQSMETANRHLGSGIEGLLGAEQRLRQTMSETDRTLDTLKAAATTLSETGTASARNVAELSNQVVSLQTSAVDLAGGVKQIAEHLAKADERGERIAITLANEIKDKLGSLQASVPTERLTPTQSTETGESLRVLRQISAGIDELRSAPRPSLVMQLVVPGVAAGICVGLGYWIIQHLR